jgi:hypothetical protein
MAAAARRPGPRLPQQQRAAGTLTALSPKQQPQPQPHLRQVVGDDDGVAQQLDDDASQAQPLAAARAQDLDDLRRAAEEAAREHRVAEADGDELGEPAGGGGAGRGGWRGGGGGCRGRERWRRNGGGGRGRRARRGAGAGAARSRGGGRGALRRRGRCGGV